MSENFDINANLVLNAPKNLDIIARQVENRFSNIKTDVKINFNSNLSGDVNKLSGSFSKLNSELASAANNSKNVTVAFRSMASAINNFSTRIKQASNGSGLEKINKDSQSADRSMSAFSESIAKTTLRFSTFVVVASTFNKLVNSIGEGINDTLKYQNSLVKLSQVGNDSKAVLKGISDEIIRLSTGLGVASSDLIHAAQLLRQAGFSADQTKKSLDALASASLAPSFTDFNNAIQGLIAIKAQFGATADDFKSILGSINAVSNEFAVESNDLVTGIRTAGAAFKQAGGDLDQFLALFTVIKHTTQESSESIATALKTIFARIQRPEIINQFKELGVQLRDAQGNFTGGYEAFKKISQAMNNLNPQGQLYQQLSESVAGERQYARFISAIKNFDQAEKALLISKKGQNSIDESTIKAQDSLIVKLTKVREEFLSIFKVLSESDNVKKFADFMLGLAKAATTLVKSLEPLIPILTAVGAFKIAGPVVQGFAGALGIRRATGGSVPGSGDTDSVPAMLTPGEEVVKKSSVRKLKQKFGPDFFNILNNHGNIPHFAEGGNVPNGPFTDQDLKNANVRLTKSNRYVDLKTGKLIKKDAVSERVANFSVDPLEGPHERYIQTTLPKTYHSNYVDYSDPYGFYSQNLTSGSDYNSHEEHILRQQAQQYHTQNRPFEGLPESLPSKGPLPQNTNTKLVEPKDFKYYSGEELGPSGTFNSSYEYETAEGYHNLNKGSLIHRPRVRTNINNEAEFQIDQFKRDNGNYPTPSESDKEFFQQNTPSRREKIVPFEPNYSPEVTQRKLEERADQLQRVNPVASTYSGVGHRRPLGEVPGKFDEVNEITHELDEYFKKVKEKIEDSEKHNALLNNEGNLSHSEILRRSKQYDDNKFVQSLGLGINVNKTTGINPTSTRGELLNEQLFDRSNINPTRPGFGDFDSNLYGSQVQSAYTESLKKKPNHSYTYSRNLNGVDEDILEGLKGTNPPPPNKPPIGGDYSYSRPKGPKGPKGPSGPGGGGSPNEPPDDNGFINLPKNWKRFWNRVSINEKMKTSLIRSGAGIAGAAAVFAPYASEKLFGSAEKPGYFGATGAKAGAAGLGAVGGIGAGALAGAAVGGPVGLAIGALVGLVSAFKGASDAAKEFDNEVAEITKREKTKGFDSETKHYFSNDHSRLSESAQESFSNLVNFGTSNNLRKAGLNAGDVSIDKIRKDKLIPLSTNRKGELGRFSKAEKVDTTTLLGIANENEDVKERASAIFQKELQSGRINKGNFDEYVNSDVVGKNIVQAHVNSRVDQYDSGGATARQAVIEQLRKEVEVVEKTIRVYDEVNFAFAKTVSNLHDFSVAIGHSTEKLSRGLSDADVKFASNRGLGGVAAINFNTGVLGEKGKRLNDIAGEGGELERVERGLSPILEKVFGEHSKNSTVSISDLLKETLEKTELGQGLSPDTKKQIANAFQKPEDAKRLEDEFKSGGSAKVSNEILKNFSSIRDSFVKVKQNLDKVGSDFISRLEKYSESIEQIREIQTRAAHTNVVGTRLRAEFAASNRDTQDWRDKNQFVNMYGGGTDEFGNATHFAQDAKGRVTEARYSTRGFTEGEFYNALNPGLKDLHGEQAIDRLSLNTLNSGLSKEQQSLTGLSGGAEFDPAAIGRNLESQKAARDQALVAQKNAEKNNDSQGIRQASSQFAEFSRQAANSQKALENLADASKMTAAAQEKLARVNQQIENDQKSRLSYAENYINASPKERVEMNRNQFFAQTAIRQGNFGGFNDKQIQGALSFFNQAGQTQLQKGVDRNGNPTFGSAENIKNTLLLKSGFGQLDLRNPLLAQRAELQDRVGAGFDNAENASKILVDNLKQSNQEFLNDLRKLFGEYFQQHGEQAQHKANGGAIWSPKGTDTVPAMLTPGEFVVPRNAAQKNMRALKDMVAGKTIYRADGGSVLTPQQQIDAFDEMQAKRREIQQEKQRKQIAEFTAKDQERLARNRLKTQTDIRNFTQRDAERRDRNEKKFFTDVNNQKIRDSERQGIQNSDINYGDLGGRNLPRTERQARQIRQTRRQNQFATTNVVDAVTRRESRRRSDVAQQEGVAAPNRASTQSSAMKEAAGTFAKLTHELSNFSNSAKTLATALSKTNIPSQVTHTFSGNVNVNLNGAEVMGMISGELKKLIYEEINAAIQKTNQPKYGV